MKLKRLFLTYTISMLTGSICMAMNESFLLEESDTMEISHHASSSSDSSDSDDMESCYSDSESIDGFEDPLDSDTIQKVAERYYQLGLNANYSKELLDNMVWAVAMPSKQPLGCWTIKGHSLANKSFIESMSMGLRRQFSISKNDTIRFFQGTEELQNEEGFNEGFLECLKIDDLETTLGYLNDQDLFDIIIEQRLHRMALWKIIPCPHDADQELARRKEIARILCTDSRVLSDKKACDIINFLLKFSAVQNWLEAIYRLPSPVDFDMESNGMSTVD